MDNEVTGAEAGLPRANGTPTALTAVVSDEEAAAARAYARRVLALSDSAARLSVEEKMLAFAVRCEPNIRAQVEWLESTAEAAEGDERTAIESRLEEQRRMLARCLRDQGRLDDAAAACEDYRPQIERGREAIDRDDGDWCSCATSVTVLRRIYSERRGWLYLCECGACGHMNATADTPPRALQAVRES